MKKFIIILFSLGIFSWQESGLSQTRYGESLCNTEGYSCIKVAKKQTWNSLYQDPTLQDIVKRVNRINIPLVPGMILAIPNNLAELTVLDAAPFPRFIEPTGGKSIVISQKQLAWAAYDALGSLVWWGPVSTGRDYCKDIKRGCTTPVGAWRTFNKDAHECQSTIFPLETNGGAPMPFCMYFFLGYALHGSPEVPGYRDSHGCVRMFVEDAKWLNEEFIDLPNKDSGEEGTRVTIEPP